MGNGAHLPIPFKWGNTGVDVPIFVTFWIDFFVLFCSTPGRRANRHDIGDGMEIPHRGGGGGGGQPGGVADGEPELYIWGTSVDINQCKADFRTFLEQFVKIAGEDGEEEEENPDAMDEGALPTTGFYYLDMFDVVSFQTANFFIVSSLMNVWLL